MMHIVGASGHAKVILDILVLQGLEISGIWDDNESSEFLLPVQGSVATFLEYNSSNVILAIGNNQVRKKIALRLTNPTTVTAIHPKSVVSEFALIGTGTVVMANASINAGSKIGNHVIVNTNASVDHDCVLEDYVHISPQVGLAGNVEVGEGTHIGIGACIIQGIKIGKWVTIGAGSVIIRDVPDYAVVVGNPGKIIKYNKFKNDEC